MWTELCAVAATVTDDWNFRSSVEDQRSELAGVYAVEVLASRAFGRGKGNPALWQRFERALRTGKGALRPRAESACDNVESVLERLVDSHKNGDPRWVDCVV